MKHKIYDIQTIFNLNPILLFNVSKYQSTVNSLFKSYFVIFGIRRLILTCGLKLIVINIYQKIKLYSIIRQNNLYFIMNNRGCH